MKWKKEQKFDCETYLQTLAMGIHSPVAEEHVANCNFCRDIHHGGSEEFPLSLKEAADEMRAEKRRKARRTFLKRTSLVAASVLGGVLIGLGLSENSSESQSPQGARTSVARDFAFLDAQYAAKGRQQIEIFVVSGSEALSVHTLRWIVDRTHSQLFDLLCASLGGRTANIQTQAFVLLRSMDPILLKPHLATLLRAAQRVKSARLRKAVEELAARVESS